MADPIDLIASKLDDHIENTNDVFRQTNRKLDQLIQLNTTIASLTERQINHGDAIQRLERRLSEEYARTAKDIDALESKMVVYETAHKHVVDKIFAKIDGLIDKKGEEALAIKAEAKAEHEANKTALKEVTTSIVNLSNDYHAKANFSRGVLWVLSIAFAASQYWIASYVSESKDKQASIAKANEVVVNRLNENDQAFDAVRRDILTLKKGR